jgi:putative transposase
VSEKGPERRHRQSLRLAGYDYAQAGAYFITVCAVDRACLFGDISAGALRASDAGLMVARWWNALPSRFPSVEIDQSVLMPNHWHGILVLGAGDGALGGGLGAKAATLGGPCQAGRGDTTAGAEGAGAVTLGGPYPPRLADVVRWFKTMSTNEYFRGVKTLGWPAAPGRLWQRNYYEHIIRSEASLARIREYIATNPARWAEDQENPFRAAPPAPTDDPRTW